VADACRQITSAVSGRAVDAPTSSIGGAGASSFVETFRLLAVNVQQMAVTQGIQSILVMSAYAGDGRTLTVVNLARALAEMGLRVVVVETAGPAVAPARPLALSANGKGPASANGTASAADAAAAYLRASRTAAQSTLSVTQGDPAAIKDMLEALRPLTDVVLLDSPACLHNADAYMLAPLVDGVIYVVRRRRQDVNAQREIQAHLTRLGARVLGAVYNEA
jgi:Mrp family chromosome partitioning ATPase